jgi:hypothetical protein
LLVGGEQARRSLYAVGQEQARRSLYGFISCR